MPCSCTLILGFPAVGEDRLTTCHRCGTVHCDSCHETLSEAVYRIDTSSERYAKLRKLQCPRCISNAGEDADATPLGSDSHALRNAAVECAK